MLKSGLLILHAPDIVGRKSRPESHARLECCRSMAYGRHFCESGAFGLRADSSFRSGGVGGSKPRGTKSAVFAPLPTGVSQNLLSRSTEGSANGQFRLGSAKTVSPFNLSEARYASCSLASAVHKSRHVLPFGQSARSVATPC